MNKQKGFATFSSHERGFAPILILVGILVMVAVAAGAYYFGKSQIPKPQTTVVVSQTQQPTPLPSSIPDETVDWKTYNFESFKLSFKYPSTWFVDSSGSAQFPTIRIQNYDPNTAPARGYDPLQDKGKYLLEVTRLPWGNSGIFSLTDLKNKIPKSGEDAYYIGDPAGKVVIKTEREFEINGFPALYREITYTGKPEALEEATYLLDKSGYVIEVRFGLDESGGKEIMNKILSTFKFLP